MQVVANKGGDITKIPPDIKANIVDRYQRGQSIRFICVALSKSSKTLKLVLAEAGIEIQASRGRWRPMSMGPKRHN